MWPEDDINDYSYMALQKKHAEAVQAQRNNNNNNSMAREATRVLAFILKNIM